MPELIWFEWEKCPDGYSVEVLKPEYVVYAPSGIIEYAPSETAPFWWKQNRSSHANLNNDPLFKYFEFGDAFIIPNSQRRLTFNPLDESGGASFLELADCVGSESNTLAFVTKYGALTVNDVNEGEIYSLENCHVRLVQEYAQAMKSAVEMWELAKSSNDYVDLVHLFNKSIGNPPRLEGFESKYDVLGALSPELRHNRAENSPPILSMVPHDFYSVLWLEFAQAISSNLMLRRCAVCPTWFAYGTGTGRRKSAHYCSDKCRKAAHRRQKLANPIKKEE